MNAFIVSFDIYAKKGVMSRNTIAADVDTAKKIYQLFLSQCDEFINNPENLNAQTFNDPNDVMRVQNDDPDPDDPTQVTIYKDCHHLNDSQIVAQVQMLQLPIATADNWEDLFNA